MRIINVNTITQNIKDMCIKANHFLAEDMDQAMKHALDTEQSPLGRQILDQLQDNLKIAAEDMIPICQDTGMAVVFVKVGMKVHITGASLEDAINEGVRRAYVGGLLRLSVVEDPLFDRKNTEDNTPAVIHIEMNSDELFADKLVITAAPKGFGSENMSFLKMMTPAANAEDIMDFVIDCIKTAGSNPCPPIFVGVGIGGNFEKCAYLAKKALLRETPSKDVRYAALEERLLEKINALGIGPQGFGGDTTALGVMIEHAPTHIAGLPVAVNINCHVARHETVVL